MRALLDQACDVGGATLGPQQEARGQAGSEESERERTRLKEELADLRETVRALKSRLDSVERVLPVTAVAAPEPFTEQSEPASDGAESQPETLVTTEDAEAAEVSETSGGAAISASVPDAATVSPEEEEPTDDEGQLRELRERVLRALRERRVRANLGRLEP